MPLHMMLLSLSVPYFAQPISPKLLASPQYDTTLDAQEVLEELSQPNTPKLLASPQHETTLDAQEALEELSQLKKDSETLLEEGKLRPGWLETEARMSGVKRSAPEEGEDD